MSELREVLDVLDLALARGETVLDPAEFADLTEIGGRSRNRQGFVGEALVVALAGGTGSGKSSIVNGLVGASVVETGIVRPTTQVATAIYEPHELIDLLPLLDDLRVDRQIRHDDMGHLVLVDLPDFDSTAEAHRHIVEEVLPRVDAVAWVLDPEKYADPVLHDEFLTPLTSYQQQIVFVLNQVDRLGNATPAVVESLEARLLADGFPEPSVVTTTAVAQPGSPVDVSQLDAVIHDRLDAKTTVLSKVALDLRGMAARAWRACVEVDTRDMGLESRDRVALAASTFVSLGVEAYELSARLGDTAGGSDDGVA